MENEEEFSILDPQFSLLHLPNIEETSTGVIEDPWYSRALDVHRWSDHPDAAKVMQTVWEEHFAGWDRPSSAPGPKPKTSYKSQLRALILDLYVAWLEDPALSIGVPMSANVWDTSSRYNALHLSKKIIDLIRQLDSVGLIDVAKGSYSGPGALTNRTTRIAFQSFRDDWSKGHYGKGMSNDDLSSLLDAFTRKHPHLQDLMCADQGIRLMNLDGQIAERVHRNFTAQGVPVLSVHDSFIIDYTRVAELKRVMAAESAEVAGIALPVSAKALGLDEMEAEHRVDYVAWYQVPRTLGFLERLQRWETRTGVTVVPYDREGGVVKN